MISALRGGSGKTLITLGLLSAWRDEGHEVAPFKKGPDFIDAGWHAFAAGRKCYNLDPFMMNEDQILESFISKSDSAALALIEGNRGLYDGLDVDGCCSTAELARMLDTPVLLIVDVTMATRTVAALVKGCQAFDPSVHIAGVILNRVATPRQESLIHHAIERYCDVSVLGTLPRLKENLFPERHMGLVPHQEREQAEKAVSWARNTVKENLQLRDIWQAAHQAEDLKYGLSEKTRGPISRMKHTPQIGFIRDRAFWFYYPENLEQLNAMGAHLIEIDALSHRKLPKLDALYVGGGFPETHAAALAENAPLRNDLKMAIEQGLPVYAECGGAMYLGEHVLVRGNQYPMVGAIPINFVLQKKPQGHGYTVMKVDVENPYFPLGEIIKGHEFHYSKAELLEHTGIKLVFKVNRGCGMIGERDGVFKKNLLATYTHVHAMGHPLWAEHFFKLAVTFKET
jgi:cobyrinic acid a,c-diamide synthase